MRPELFSLFGLHLYAYPIFVAAGIFFGALYAAGGIAILQTPFASGLEKTLEDPAEIDTDEKRIEFYGQEDHIRLYGRDLFDRIRAAGFALELKKHAECLPDIDAERYGVNPDEPLFLCRKAKA